ncbi:uncharacterized protein LOC130150685 isoform X1 [Falco biarmicus]|uniref:uncharacterized protein LOC130150685 isoform X1 n=1 Tax=Falco biarmicus TaxID=345155 RepID=UPI0024BCED28|nr:uncharacterized protein LOC130150685 isoform X1 [Falco biarmicus]
MGHCGSMRHFGPHSTISSALLQTQVEQLTWRSWRIGEVPEDRRKANVTVVFKNGQKEDAGNYKLVSITSIPGKVVEQLILEDISKHVEEKKVIRSSQHGFTKGKSCLTNLIAFYDGMTGWVEEGRAVDVVYLDLSKAFDIVFHNILLGTAKEMQRNQRYIPRASSGLFGSRGEAAPSHFLRAKTAAENGWKCINCSHYNRDCGHRSEGDIIFLFGFAINFVLREPGQLKALQERTRHFIFC